MSDASRISDAIHSGLKQAGGPLSKPILRKLSGAVSAVVVSKSVNTNEIAACLPIQTVDKENRWQWLNRLLSNPLVVEVTVLRPLHLRMLRDVHERAKLQGLPVELIIDQTSIRGKPGVEQEIVMLALRMGHRGYPLSWFVRRGAGGIGYADYEQLLHEMADLLTEAGIAATEVLLLGDRFYGCSDLIGLCQRLKWQYRLRLRTEINIDAGIWSGKTSDLPAMKPENRDKLLKNKVLLTDAETPTYIGYLWEQGHPEPWIIAMDMPPSIARLRQYGDRWGIEAMFSDLKSRNFGLGESQIQRPDKLSRLLLLLTLALWWLIRTGQAEQKKGPDSTQTPDQSYPG